MPLPTSTKEHARVLILESDPEIARRLVAALATSRVQSQDDPPLLGGASGASSAEKVGACRVFECVRDLVGEDLSKYAVCLAATSLGDALGPDVLSRVNQLAPHLPVVVVGPIADIAMAPEFIRAGAADVVALTGHELVTIPLAVRKAIAQQQLKEENEELHSSLTRAAAELAEANRRLEGTIRRLEVAVRTDDLTELMNRRWLDLTLEARWIEAARHDQDLGLIMIDLDGFKQLNDQRGHQAGDDVLRLVGRVLRETCREIDTAARYGGDEFCVLLPHADLDATLTVGHRIIDGFRAALVARGLDDLVDLSVGVATRCLGCPATSQALLVQADEAMYAAKQGGLRLMIHRRSQHLRRIA
ncbi:MAG: diguanylate cyclase [Phycisphaerales bacterium]|nr:diguanylate cyclase [Phycisphaerales bacterium]